MSAVYSIYTSPNHAPIPNHLPTLIITPHGQPHHTLYSYIHTSFNKESYLLTPSPQGDLCVAKMVPPPGSRGPGGPGGASSEGGHSDPREKAVKCEASRNLKWSITNTGIAAPVYKLTLPNPDSPGNEQPLFQISKPNPNATFWTMFYFTYAGHLIPPKRIEFGKIQKNAAAGSGGGGGTRVSITGKTPEEKAVWQTLGEGNEDMVEWIVLCAALNVLDEEIIKAADKGRSQAAPSNSALNIASGSKPSGPAKAVPSSRPTAQSRSPQPRPMAGPPGGYAPQARPPPPNGGAYGPPMSQGGPPMDPRAYAPNGRPMAPPGARPGPPQGMPMRAGPPPQGMPRGPGPQYGGMPPGAGQRGGPPPQQMVPNGRHF